MLKNVGSNWALNAVQIVVFLVLTPFVVNTLGEDLYGGWVTIVSLTGILQLFILGIPMASVRYIAEHVAKEDVEGANRAVSTCLAITLGMGLVALAAGALLSLGLDRYLVSDRWTLTALQAEDARAAYAVVVVSLGMGFALRLPYGIFDAHHDFIARNLIMGSGFLVKLGLTVGMLHWRVSLTVLASIQIVVMVLEFLIAVLVSRRRHPGIRIGLGHVDRSLVRGILSFSIFSMLVNMGSMLAFRVDALVIGAHASQGEVTVYDLGNKIFDPFLNLVLAIGMVVMPMATSLKARGKEAELGEIFLKWSKICLSLVLLIGTYLLVLGPEFLRWWLADEYDPRSGQLLQILMASFLVFLPVRGVALPALMGLGLPVRPAVGLLVMGLANLTLSIGLIGPLGLVGVALGTAIPCVLYAIFVAYAACLELGVRMRDFVGHVAGRALLGVLPPAALLVVLKLTVETWGVVQLGLAGVAFVGLYALSWVFFVYKGDPHLDLYEKVVDRLRGSKK